MFKIKTRRSLDPVTLKKRRTLMIGIGVLLFYTVTISLRHYFGLGIE